MKSNQQNPIIKQLMQLPLFACGHRVEPYAVCATPPFLDQNHDRTIIKYISSTHTIVNNNVVADEKQPENWKVCQVWFFFLLTKIS